MTLSVIGVIGDNIQFFLPSQSRSVKNISSQNSSVHGGNEKCSQIEFGDNYFSETINLNFNFNPVWKLRRFLQGCKADQVLASTPLFVQKVQHIIQTFHSLITQKIVWEN